MAEPDGFIPEVYVPGTGRKAYAKRVAAERKKFLDQEFYPQPPPELDKDELDALTMPERKARFLTAFNASGSVPGLACRAAGITRATLRDWLKDDAEFKQAHEDTSLEVVDRARIIFNQRTGLINDPKLVLEARSISDNLLALMMRSICPEIYGDKVSGSITLKIEVPRAVRPVDGDVAVQADRPPDGLPHLPS